MINNNIASPIYNKLSSVYDQLYLQNIHTFQNKVADNWLGDGWFVDFYPSLGIKPSQACDLLFYGQALNGWSSGFDVFGEYAQEKVNESIITSNRYFAKHNHSPLDWVNVRWNIQTFISIADDEEAKLFYTNGDNYRAYRSFFWQVVSKLTNDLYGFDRTSSRWSKKIV
jgi:hypothetical protein